MLLNWFDADEAKQFGVSLAHSYLEKSASALSRKKEKAIEKKQEEILGSLVQQIVQFKREHKLNIYKKAHVGNSFKWTLKEAGVDPDYVDQLTDWLMHGL